jgi:CheY-like chemotaxis protein
MKIFVVDDDPSLRRFIQRWLAAHTRHEVHTFESGEEAVLALETLSPNLVLSDLGMPGLSGEDVALAAARLPQPPRVVLMSGDPVRLGHARELAQATLEKPFSISELLSVLGATPDFAGC